ncbi:hypothetical protein [Rheinheimera baltica]|uniref:hypothetical protein n=1 Tax=Rheinheimera baltica TaxID=67576 RepID=UPI00273D9B6C|nr:hypothetical protein [Rheinheimera baltica]MDP5150160.1 hypothetical protein [Rheinheimera baltica]
MSRNILVQRFIKSRFTGFFAFLLLSACQPVNNNQAELMRRAADDPVAAVTLASQRLASAEYDAALRWFRHAALLGDDIALHHALQLQQREQGRLATAQWLQQQLDSNTINNAAVNLAQRAELGLWQQNKPRIAGISHALGCKLTLQPVISQQAGADNWQSLSQQWQQDPQLSQLPVCFLPVYTLDSTVLGCTESSDTLIQCHYRALDTVVETGRFSQLLVIAGRGKASYNNGILQLPDNADLALFRHEFMHVLGFVDEYPLTEQAAIAICKPGMRYPNLIIGDNSTAYLQHWQLAPEDIALTAVKTCQSIGQQAYSVVSATNVMRFYELGLPDLYLALAQQVLQNPQQLMPVQYYFAYLARQQQSWLQWQQFMQRASEQGYADAQQALAVD